MLSNGELWVFAIHYTLVYEHVEIRFTSLNCLASLNYSRYTYECPAILIDSLRSTRGIR